MFYVCYFILFIAFYIVHNGQTQITKQYVQIRTSQRVGILNNPHKSVVCFFHSNLINIFKYAPVISHHYKLTLSSMLLNLFYISHVLSMQYWHILLQSSNTNIQHRDTNMTKNNSFMDISMSVPNSI